MAEYGGLTRRRSSRRLAASIADERERERERERENESERVRERERERGEMKRRRGVGSSYGYFGHYGKLVGVFW